MTNGVLFASRVLVQYILVLYTIQKTGLQYSQFSVSQ